MIIGYIQKNPLEWRAERFLFAKSFFLLRAMILKKRSSLIIKLDIRARPSLLIKLLNLSQFSQLIN
jgi:hypothetical protein